MITKINVGELRRVLREESEFKPLVFGDKESKRINDKAYSDIMKETEKYDGGLTNKKKPTDSGFKSDNKGMHDLEYDSISKPFEDRVKSQMKGYVSKDAEDKHKKDEFGNASFDNDGKAYNDAKEHAKQSQDDRVKTVQATKAGDKLQTKDIKDLHKTMFGENKKIKRLTFNKTEFLSEGHVMSRIPDEYKKEGNKFIMRDSAHNEYLVEWNSKEPKITKKLNMELVNEQKNRIKQLWNYKSSEAHTSSPSERIQEDKSFADMVNKVRKLME